MAVSSRPAERATFDFFGAQARARRRTVLLVVSFVLALAVVVVVVYLALLAVVGMLVPGANLDQSADILRLKLLQPALLLIAAASVATVVGLGAAYHALRLTAGGGEAVAQMLGGTLLDRARQDPAEHRLVDVAEEMAIAAGIPVPRLYVLERENDINAFAAGYTPGHSVVAVTRGALDQLSRDELQGVVAHEFSHLLNADTRIDLQLMAAVGGLTILSLLGRFILRSASWSSRSRDKGGGVLFLVGLAFLVAGAFGMLCGKLVRYAVAREREWLADAAGVQFTRNPDGLVGALRKIAAEGSVVQSPHEPEAEHLFFASGEAGFFSGLLSTHPPIEERIRRITSLEGGRRNAPIPIPPRPQATAPESTVAPIRLSSPPTPEHIAQAASLLERVPPALTAATRDPLGACGVVCVLLLGDSPEGRAAQLTHLERRYPTLRAEVAKLAPGADLLSSADRMALLQLALPALDALSPAQVAALRAELPAFVAAGGTLTPFEWAARRVALRRLTRDGGAPPRVILRTLDEVQPECLDLLSTIAWTGNRDGTAAQAALDAGVRALGFRQHWRLLPPNRVDSVRFDATLSRLDQASSLVKGQVLAACIATVLADARVTVEEAELVRAISASLGLAMPPVLAGVAGPRAVP